MIKSLALTNFKSIGKTLIVDDEEITEGKLELKPLTIFCGKNSSGKSTVLQSILLLTQTLQNNVPSQTLVLNGPMVKLGSVDDIKSVYTNSDDKDIIIDIDINVSKQIEKITKSSVLDENVRRVFVENISQYYYISNNIEEIKEALNENLGDHFLDLDHKLRDENWTLNFEIAEDIKNVMNKHHVNFSARVWRGIDNYEYKIEIHQRIGEKWYSIYFNENKFVYRNKLSSYNSLEVEEYFNNINNNKIQNLCISFCKEHSDEKSRIIPIINYIHIDTPDMCTFTASYREKPKDIILYYNDFKFYDFEFDDNIKKPLWNIEKLEGLILRNFLPSEFVYLSSKADDEALKTISDCVFEFLNADYQFNDQSAKNYNHNLCKLLTNNKYNLDISDSEINEIIKRLSIPEDITYDKDSFIPFAKNCIAVLESIDFPEKLSKNILLSYKEHNDKFKSKLEENYIFTHNISTGNIEGALQNSVNIIINYFSSVHYIGPLREEPHLQYTGYVNSIENIGIKGENCAAVLYHNKEKPIKYIDPKYLDQNYKINNCYLNDAINNWLFYIGVSASVSSLFNGRYGYELKVNSFDAKKSGDLTSVGVGVSQVLPIILTCLLAPEESTIIIEQPELHLHPAMQTKLTDFFVATMLCNKQVIIETHSEYIINRLRQKAIKWPTGKSINEDLKIYFTSVLNMDIGEYKMGNTVFKPLEINEYAAISDWPEGFFDESSKIADEIIKDISEKWKKDEVLE